MGLTEKQLAFVNAFMVTGLQRDAAVAAGYSPNTAHVAGCRLMKHPAIIYELAKRRGQTGPEVLPTAAPLPKSKQKPAKAKQTKPKAKQPPKNAKPAPRKLAPVIRPAVEQPEAAPAILPPAAPAAWVSDPVEYMLSVMNDPRAPPALRADMAKAAAPYIRPKVGEVGKKVEKNEKAKAASAGKFSPSAPPKLVSSR